MITKDFAEYRILGATSDEKNQLMTAIYSLPEQHRVIIETIKIMSETEWQSYCEDLQKTTIGMTDTLNHMVTLVRERCKNDLVFNALHEIGHLVWHYYLNENEKLHFVDTLEVATSNQLTPITEWAKLNHLEYFAEAYSLYLLKPKSLRRKVPSVYRWLKNYVFHGVIYLRLENKLKNAQTEN